MKSSLFIVLLLVSAFSGCASSPVASRTLSSVEKHQIARDLDSVPACPEGQEVNSSNQCVSVNSNVERPMHRSSSH